MLLKEEEQLPSFGLTNVKKHATFKGQRESLSPKRVNRKPSSEDELIKSSERNFTCLLFETQIEKMRSLGTKIKDPREMMAALREIQSEIS